MTAHTPGPWRWLSADVLVGDHGRRPVVITANRRGDLVTRGDDGLLRTMTPDDGNARVIAAAPDLLAALKALTDRHASLVNSGDCGFWNPEDEEQVIAARAAIAKAEGR